MTEVLGESLSFWKGADWWPKEPVTINAGFAGHDREIVVSFLGEYDGYHERLPVLVADIFTALLPETWKIQNRGSRIEVHPTGRFAGGFDAVTDIPVVERALREMGIKVERVEARG